jgi:hypothetical protein
MPLVPASDDEGDARKMETIYRVMTNKRRVEVL